MEATNGFLLSITGTARRAQEPIVHNMALACDYDCEIATKREHEKLKP